MVASSFMQLVRISCWSSRSAWYISIAANAVSTIGRSRPSARNAGALEESMHRAEEEIERLPEQLDGHAVRHEREQ
eukprot:6131814-Prymnesium_polylepis.2